MSGKLLPISKPNTALAIIFLFTFLLLIKPPLGGDFGWHLMTGKHILSTLSIPQTDLFSHSNPNYPYAYHSWGTEVLMYLVYSKFSLIGIAAFFATICATAFSLLAKISLPKLKNPFFLLAIPTLAIPIDMLTGISIRTQSFSFLFLSIIYLLISNTFTSINQTTSLAIWLKTTKLWLLLPLFLLWVNLHGGFVLGLGFYLLIILTHLATHIHKIDTRPYQKLYRYHAIIFLICALATLINPYTHRVHQLAFTMLTNRTAATANLDWVPFYLRSQGQTPTIFLSLVIPYLLTITLTKLSVFNKLLLTSSFLLTFVSPRFTTLFVTVLLPFTPTSFQHLITRLKHAPLRVFTSLTFLLLSLALLLKAPITNAKNLICAQANSACFAQIGQQVRITYPHGAIQFFKHHPSKPNLLNNFNWGGYITWQLPGTKIFADGKMDNYIINGQSFITIYQNLVLAQPGWQDPLNHYQINTVLLGPNEPIVTELKKSPDWQVVFQDDISVVLEKTTRD